MSPAHRPAPNDGGRHPLQASKEEEKNDRSTHRFRPAVASYITCQGVGELIRISGNSVYLATNFKVI